MSPSLPQLVGRDIKFRAWDLNNKRFFPHEELCDYSLFLRYEGDKPDLELNLYKFILKYQGVDPQKAYVLQQFIGLQDKNNKDIYEGDIVRLFGDNEELYEVVYDTYDDFPTPAFILENENGRGDWFAKKDREVVGNIFENPELLAPNV
jgi:uncharacterized phage protein (TIGR01671 family)